MVEKNKGQASQDNRDIEYLCILLSSPPALQQTIYLGQRLSDTVSGRASLLSIRISSKLDFGMTLVNLQDESCDQRRHQRPGVSSNGWAVVINGVRCDARDYTKLDSSPC